MNFRNTFDNLAQLRQLSLEKNKLKSLDKELFKPLTSLDILILDHNYLEDINGVFTVLTNLKYLSLVHNSIKWFDMGAFFPKSVERINLSKNMIEASRLSDKTTQRKIFFFFPFYKNFSSLSSYYIWSHAFSLGNWKLLQNV